MTTAEAGRGGDHPMAVTDRPCKRVGGGRGWAVDERWRRVGIENLQAAGRGYVSQYYTVYGSLAHYFFFYGSILILRSKNLTERFTDICSDTKDKICI